MPVTRSQSTSIPITLRNSNLKDDCHERVAWNDDQPAKDGIKPAKPIHDPVQVEPASIRGAFVQPSSQDKLASDRIGEELNPDGSIWRLYAEEANEYDKRMAQDRNRNLNTMLLFATLFSAIVTAFLIQSTDLLEQDYPKESMQLLLALVQSQQRIEAGTPNATSPPIGIAKFAPSAAARATNVLWFAALMISLGAAVVAMLAKEWLSAFILYRTRHAHEYALERQMRLKHLETWNMRPIIGLLPISLNFALFLFALGLVVRLWDLDVVVAAILTGMSVVVSMLYLYFVFAGALCPTCPYKSRLSTYVRWITPRCILKFFETGKPLAPDAQKTIQPEEIYLLTWLLKRTSDPYLGSYVTQALAGLRSLPLGLPTFLNKEKAMQESELYNAYTENSKFISTLFDLGVQAINQLRLAPTRCRNELATWGGLNVARLAIAISELYPHALTYELCLPKNTPLVQENPLTEVRGDSPEQDNALGSVAQDGGVLIRVTQPSPTENDQEKHSEDSPQAKGHSSTDTQGNKATRDDASILAMACKITDLDKVFSALDLVWAETSPALTLNAYAYLAAAELKIIRHSLAFSARAGSKHNTLPNLYQGKALQERASCALSRTALVLKSSLYQLTAKGSQTTQSAIADLLLEALELVNQERPKPDSARSQFGTDPNSDVLYKEISITIATKHNTTHRVTCLRQPRSFELMEGLIELCWGDAMADTLCLEGFRVAAFNLLIAFWLGYFQQLNIDRDQQLTEVNNDGYDPRDFYWAVQEWEAIRFQTTPYDSQTSAEIIIYRTIVVTYVAISLRAFDFIAWQPWNTNKNDILRLIFRSLSSWSSALSKIAERLKNNHSQGEISVYQKWLPTNGTLVDWILLISAIYPDSVTNNAKYAAVHDEAPRWLSWCILHLITTTETLSNGRIDILAQLRSSHLDTQSSDTANKHLPLKVHQVMNFIYTASQAIGTKSTTPVIGALLGQVTSYINGAVSGCRDCLSSFTEGPGFYILSKIGPAELDRAAAAGVVSAVIAELHTAEIPVHDNIVPSLFEAMCCVCDTDELALHDTRPFINGAIFQLQNLCGGIGHFVTPETVTSILKVLDKLNSWVKEWSGCESRSLDTIIALQRQVQECMDQPSWGSPDCTSAAPDPPEPIFSTLVPSNPRTDTPKLETDAEVYNSTQPSKDPILPTTSGQAPRGSPIKEALRPLNEGDVGSS